MKIKTSILKLDLTRGNEVETVIPFPFRVLKSFIHFEPKSAILTPAGASPEIIAYPCILFEFDPESPRQTVKLAIVPAGAIIDLDQLEACDYLAAFEPPGPGQMPLVVYRIEGKPTPAEAIPVDDRPAPINGEIVEAPS